MHIVLNILVPVFGVVLMGYGASRIGWFSENAANGLARFVFDFAVPLLLFRTVATTNLPETVPVDLFGSFYSAAIFMYVAGFLIARYAFRRDFNGQTITGFSFAFGNSVLLGLPLMLTAFGETGSLPFFLLLSVHGLSYLTTTTVLLEIGRNREAALRALPMKVLKGMVTNPIILGILAGLAFNLAGFTIPEPIDNIAKLFQGAVTPCSLFALGAQLVRYGFAGRLVQSMTIVTAKLVIMPLIVYLLGTYVFSLDPLWVQVAVLLAAQPVGVNVFLFAERYQTGQAIATTSIFLSTAFSVVTIGIILGMFGLGGG